MPRQVPFTEYEAALLLDAYLKTLSGEKERMESVRDCSLQLRQMALNAGSEIDDIYRNVNGISFQMASMESAYQGHTIMKPATRLFTEIVFLYRNDAARYRQLLKEAKGMASAKIDNEAVFMAWLAQNASGVQLSELYLAFKEIEQQAKKVKIIRTSLYESLDPSTIKKVKAGVESSKIFKFTHKHQWGRITSALNYLLQFASQKTTETKTQETARVEMVESVKELEIVPSPDISSNALLKENIKSTKVTHIETEQDMDQSGAATTVNFHRINSMAFSKPVSLSYFGEVKPESSWKGLYVDACKSLLDDYPDIFTRLKAESLHGSGKTWLVDAENLHLLAVPKQLEEGLFVETNRNASDLVKNLKWLLDECSVDYENVVITYTNKDGKKEASVPAPVTTSAFQKKQYYRQDKEDFYRWLQNDQHMAEGTCRSYVSAIRGAEHFAEEHGLVSRKLYTCDPAVAKATADELFSNAEFIQYNNDQHNRFRAAITKLLVFYGSNWSTIEASTPRTFERSPLQTEEISIDVAPYKTILVEHFSKGYRLESALDMKRMRRYYEELTGKALALNQSILETAIRNCGIVYDGRLYMPQNMLSDEMRDQKHPVLLPDVLQGFGKIVVILHGGAIRITDQLPDVRHLEANVTEHGIRENINIEVSLHRVEVFLVSGEDEGVARLSIDAQRHAEHFIPALIPPRLCRRKIAAVDPHIRRQQTAGVGDKGTVPGVVVPLWVNKETVRSLRVEDEQAVPGILIVPDGVFILCDEIVISQQCAAELLESLGG